MDMDEEESKEFSLQTKDPQILAAIAKFVDSYQDRFPQPFLSFGDIGLRQASIDHIYHYSQGSHSIESDNFIRLSAHATKDRSLHETLKSFFQELEEFWDAKKLGNILSTSTAQRNLPKKG